MKKEKGSVEYSLCIMLLIMCVLVLIYVLNMKIVTHTRINVDDAITGANLASAIIDMDEYKQTGEIYSYGYSDLTDSAYEYIYNLYEDALVANLNLDSSSGELVPRNKTMIRSNVKVMEYYVYDVEGNDVVEKKIIEDGNPANFSCGSVNAATGERITDTSANITVHPNGKGIIETPDGTKVRTLTVYSKIQFDVESVLGHTQTVEKEHSVDVVKNDIII